MAGSGIVIDMIRRNAEGLATERPGVRDLLMAYVAEQEREVDSIGRDVISAVWLLQRA